MYSIPSDYYFRIHHIRPRFKNNIENVLINMATEISNISCQDKDSFKIQLNNAIRLIPGNIRKTDKTINNWRTEISALFGFYESDGIETWPGRRALELAESTDLVQLFKHFLYTFQYPGAHITEEDVLKQIEAGIEFKPAQYLLKTLKYAENYSGKRIGITSAEFCHCILNDLRCTRDDEDVAIAWKRIADNRDADVLYDQTGDVIRYALDILDYMKNANLMVSYDNKLYYMNTLETETIQKFVSSKEWFSEYDSMISNRKGSLQAVRECSEKWSKYVNRDFADTDFSTDILAFISNNMDEYDDLKKLSYEIYDEKLENVELLGSKDIGDIGESLIYGHECQRVRNGGCEDLIHLIKPYPTSLYAGYDILSVELDRRKRFVEVKTTISQKPLHFNRIHLTTNEWDMASTVNDRYFVYRLMISKNEKKLFIMQDPVGLYKNNVISMTPKDGADITFDPKTSGEFEELFSWQS